VGGVRLREIAERAGVSTATVSRVLNGRSGVSPEARESVLAAIDLLGYERPARVRTASTGLVGLIVPELTNPVFTLFTQTIETLLATSGYTTMLCTQTLMTAHEDDYVRILLERGTAGIIFVAGIHAVAESDPRRYTTLRERSVPIVLIDGYLPDVDAPFISNDDVQVSEIGVRHLASLGHRRIGLAAGPDRYTTVRRRIDGFHDAVRRHLPRGPDEPPVDDLIACTRFIPEGGYKAAATLLDRGVTGILCGSDLMALGAVRAVRDRGLRVPEDVSVVGSDDNPLLEYTDPPLTTVRQDVDGMAAAAVRALLDEISGSPPPRAEYVFHPTLVVRSTTAPPPEPQTR
jgi:LacI family repressor for deo operon, udp, cdd, tsx, nupC, and nupG